MNDAIEYPALKYVELSALAILAIARLFLSRRNWHARVCAAHGRRFRRKTFDRVLAKLLSEGCIACPDVALVRARFGDEGEQHFVLTALGLLTITYGPQAGQVFHLFPLE